VLWLAPLAARLVRAPFAFGARLDGQPAGLLQTAARGCFAELVESSASAFCRLWGLQLQPGAGLFEKLEALVRFALPDISDADLLSIMQTRLLSSSGDAVQFLSEPDISEAFGGDEKEVTAFQKDAAKQDEVLEPFKRKLHELAAKVSPSRPSAKQGAKRKRTPVPVLSDNELFEEETARKFAPPHSTLFKDRFNGRWLLMCRLTNRSMSRSWQLHSEARSLAMVLQWGWKNHSRVFEDQPCLHAWIVDQLRT